jgi:hypothetical protein
MHNPDVGSQSAAPIKLCFKEWPVLKRRMSYPLEVVQKDRHQNARGDLRQILAGVSSDCQIPPQQHQGIVLGLDRPT